MLGDLQWHIDLVAQVDVNRTKLLGDSQLHLTKLLQAFRVAADCALPVLWLLTVAVHVFDQDAMGVWGRSNLRSDAWAM